MIKLTKRNIAQRRTQTTGLRVMIGRHFPDSQKRNTIVIFRMLAVYLSATTIQTIDTNSENGVGKNYITVILGATLHRGAMGKQ